MGKYAFYTFIWQTTEKLGDDTRKQATLTTSDVVRYSLSMFMLSGTSEVLLHRAIPRRSAERAVVANSNFGGGGVLVGMRQGRVLLPSDISGPIRHDWAILDYLLACSKGRVGMHALGRKLSYGCCVCLLRCAQCYSSRTWALNGPILELYLAQPFSIALTTRSSTVWPIRYSKSHDTYVSEITKFTSILMCGGVHQVQLPGSFRTSPWALAQTTSPNT
ncbi:hypothetical protein LY78DRAFT_19543 [Colletotrichum sublineola]|nr:hypothetical protein LY78DRAFT_19543 [Colletotrichum sublineola]